MNVFLRPCTYKPFHSIFFIFIVKIIEKFYLFSRGIIEMYVCVYVHTYIHTYMYFMYIYIYEVYIYIYTSAHPHPYSIPFISAIELFISKKLLK